jgi:hypothetical protein
MGLDLCPQRLLLRETLEEPPEQGSLALSVPANLVTLRQQVQVNSRVKANLLLLKAAD